VQSAVPVPAAWEPAGTGGPGSGGSAPGARWTVRRGRLRRWADPSGPGTELI